MKNPYQIVSIDCVPIGIVESMSYEREVQTMHSMGSSEVIRIPGRARIEMTVMPIAAKDLGRYILLNNREQREPLDLPDNAVDNLEHMAEGRPVLWLGWLSEQFEGWAFR